MNKKAEDQIKASSPKGILPEEPAVDETYEIPGFLRNPTVKPSVFAEAEEIVNGDREQTYGHPAKNLAATALMWKAHIEAKYGIQVPLDCFDVAWMMVGLKQCRQMHMPKRDNLVDAIGYIGLDQKIQDYQEAQSCKEKATASSNLCSAQPSDSASPSSSNLSSSRLSEST